MEYVEGRTLRDVLQQEGRLTVAAVPGDHRRRLRGARVQPPAGIIHRDIKPGNVMLTRDGVVKVMDFGIARAITGSSATMTQTAAVIGTAQYLSPEQARGETVDARSDVYSTGVLLYELLTGYPPFRGDSPVAVAYQHVREDPQPPSRLDPDIPPDVDAVVMKALAKNPANRYQSAGEMRDDLLRAAVGQPVMATPLLPYEAATQAMPPTSSYPGYQPTGYPPPRAAQKSSRRNLIWIIILAILALGAIGALAVSQLNKGPTVTVPNVVGATLAQAQNQLSTAGLQLGTVSYQQDSTKPANTVLSQNPAANATAHKNDKVDVVLNGTQEQVTIPSGIIGAPVASATSQLQSLGLVVKTNQVNSGGDPGTVTNCSPSPGTRVDKGSTVTLTYVSSLTTVPSVVGLSQSAAQSQLASMGFNVNVQQQQATSNPGVVLSQNPAGGTQQQRGSTVTIVVSQVVTPTSPPPTTPTPPPTTPNPPKTTTPPVSSAASSGGPRSSGP